MSKNFNKKTKRVKHQKVIGKESYINQQTGEIIECIVVEKNIESDFNFHKVWITDLINILEIIGTKKLKIIKWLLDNFNDKDNTIFFTQQKLSKQLGISYTIVNQTIKLLLENDFLRKIQNGVYMINPNILVKGNTSKRMNLLVKYKEIDKE
jgi:hypothetical protein